MYFLWVKIQKKRTSLSTESKHLNGFLTNFYTQSLSVKPTLANNSGYIEFPETNKFNMPQSSNVKKQNSLISNVDKSKQVFSFFPDTHSLFKWMIYPSGDSQTE